MKNILTITTIFLSALLCGCVLKFEDVSAEPEYAPLLNSVYSLQTNMLIYGVDLPIDYKTGLDFYTIKPMSFGLRGREILSTATLENGTTLEVQRVERSINAPLLEDKKVQAVVSVAPYKTSVEMPVRIEMKYLQSTNYMNKLVRKNLQPGN